MIICHIAAMAKNRTIGKDNKLPWHLPEDLKFFRSKTKGKFLIMGRKTFESLPGSLPNRTNIVVTRQKDYTAKEAVVVRSLDEALSFCRAKAQPDEEVFIGGGEEIFRQTIPLVQRIYLTEIHQDFDGDAIYPEFPVNEFKLTHEDRRQEPISYAFKTYERL